MKTLFTFVIALTFMASCSTGTNPTETASDANVDATPKIATLELAAFDTVAGNYVDKEVRIAGLVDHVCKHGGKKLFLVNDYGDIHVTSDDRFDDELIGSEVIVNGIVREFRVDEGYCLQMEEDHIQSHSEGKTDDAQFDEKMQHIQDYRDEMKDKQVDHLSYYSLEFVSLEEIPEAESI